MKSSMSKKGDEVSALDEIMLSSKAPKKSKKLRQDEDELGEEPAGIEVEIDAEPEDKAGAPEDAEKLIESIRAKLEQLESMM